MLTQVECPLSAVVTLDELPSNRLLKTVRDANGVVWLSLNSVAVAAHTYPSRLTHNMRAMSHRPQMVDRQATNPTKRTKLETLTPLAHFLAVAANHTIGGSLYPDIRGPLLTALRDGVATLYDGLPAPAPAHERGHDEAHDPPVANRLVQYTETLQNKEEGKGTENVPLAAAGDEGVVRLTAVPFHDDTILAHFDGKTPWAMVAHICDVIGVSFGGQWEKMKVKPWMKTRELRIWAKDGKRRTVYMVDAESLPLWLATIDERKCNPESRPRLLRFQLEAKKVLADYFFKRSPVPQPADTDDLRGAMMKFAEGMALMAKSQAATINRLDRLERAMASV